MDRLRTPRAGADRDHRRTLPTGRTAARRRLTLEALEARCLLAVSITESPIPTTTGSPSGITLRSDGALYFTEVASNKIGKVTPDGIVTEIATLPASSHPQGITAGPDGNLWFTESGSTAAHIAIGQLTLPETGTPVLTEYPVS